MAMSSDTKSNDRIGIGRQLKEAVSSCFYCANNRFLSHAIGQSRFSTERMENPTNNVSNLTSKVAVT